MTDARRRAAATTVTAAAERFLAMSARIEPRLHAFRQIDGDRLMAEAAESDRLPAAARGPLHGLLLGVKEVFDVAGYECAWGTPIQAGRIPAADAAAVARVKAAGALVAGITVSTEYAMSRPGPTANPHDPARTPGASSQGSAAAVGAGLVPAALGSQTIGSIIRPAAYCGCLGMKPTWGAIDGSGNMPLSEPLDHVGFLAADAALAGLLLGVLAGDAVEPAGPPPEAVALLRPWYPDAMDPAVLQALAAAAIVLRGQGIEVVETQLPEGIAAGEAETLDTLLAFDMARHHGGDLDRADGRMSDRVADYIRRGRKIAPASYAAALARRREFAEALDAWAGAGAVLMPATTGLAPLKSEGTGSRVPQRLWTLVGLPAVSVPVARMRGLPLGLQVVARRGADRRALAVAGMLMQPSV